jgi:hypothetical protein
MNKLPAGNSSQAFILQAKAQTLRNHRHAELDVLILNSCTPESMSMIK